MSDVRIVLTQHARNTLDHAAEPPVLGPHWVLCTPLEDGTQRDAHWLGLLAVPHAESPNGERQLGELRRWVKLAGAKWNGAAFVNSTALASKVPPLSKRAAWWVSDHSSRRTEDALRAARQVGLQLGLGNDELAELLLD